MNKYSLTNIYLLFFCFVYLFLGANSENVGDYSVYIDMHENGFLISFANQPLFTLYAEVLRKFISNKELFFIIMPFPILYLALNVNKDKLGKPDFIVVLVTIILPFVMSPASFYFLLRQNLGLLTLQALLSYNILFAFLFACGFHYSFALIFVAFIFYKWLINERLSSEKKVIILVFSYLIIYLLSTNLFFILEQFGGSDLSVVSTYYVVYTEYTDDFPGILNLYLFSTFSILIYFIFLDRLNVRFIKLSASLVTSVLAVAIFTNQSDALVYRYLQATKISATIIYAYFIYYCLKNFIVYRKNV